MVDRSAPRHRPYDDGRWDSRPTPVAADPTPRRPHSHQYRPYQPPPPRHRAIEPPPRQRAIEPPPRVEEPRRADEQARAAGRRRAEPPRRRVEPPKAPKIGRRKALLALGGAAALTGGAAFAGTPEGAGLIDRILGRRAPAYDPSAEAVTDGTPARPSGQQPSTVRTYTEQNESYMGSKAGDALKRNAPTGGRRFSSPAIAAQATKVTVRTALTDDPARHLASRVTFGPTPEVIEQINQLGIDDWITQQLAPDSIPPTPAEDLVATQVPEMVPATIGRQIWSNRQLLEVMVDFWNDFLHVPAVHGGPPEQRASFDRDVIRRYALENYPDMLVAANRHPALLTYLNQSASTKDAVTENLARENLELYSVGVDGGYTERDVRQAALLQTGRAVEDGEYVYRPDRHYVGPVKIMGFSHPNGSAEGGEAVGDEYLRYLATHPSTARYIATNLATRFVSDTPPKSLVDRLAKSYSVNRGQIRPVLMEMLSSSEFWAAVGQKVRRPMEYVVATYRTLGVSPETPAAFTAASPDGTPFAEGLRQLQVRLTALGHYPAGAPTPTGYPDVFVAWSSVGSMVGCWTEAGAAVAGSLAMFTYRRPEQLAGVTPPATAGAYVDVLAKRLVHQSLTDRERVLIAGVAGVAPEARVDATFNGAIVAVVRAILASPQHMLR